jgi:hypothetical protein
MRNADLIDALTRLAGARGTLSAAELRQVVPVDSMSVEDVAALIAELDARGVTIEIDPVLSTPRHPVTPEAGAAAPPRPEAPRPEAPRPAATTRSLPEGSGAASSVRAATTTPVARQPSQAAVAIAVLAAAVVVVVVVALVWAF